MTDEMQDAVLVLRGNLDDRSMALADVVEQARKDLASWTAQEDAYVKRIAELERKQRIVLRERAAALRERDEAHQARQVEYKKRYDAERRNERARDAYHTLIASHDFNNETLMAHDMQELHTARFAGDDEPS